MRAWAEAERAEVRRTRLRVSVLAGPAITPMITFVGAIAYGVVAHAQETQVAREIGLTVSHRTVAPWAEALAGQRRFVTDASHELRTPVARAHLLAAGLPADQRTDLDALAKSIRGLADVKPSPAPVQ